MLFYEIMWKNMVEPARQDTDTDKSIMLHMRNACSITNATNTQLQNENIAFPWKQWLREST
jgi:hypothetical protein